MSLLEVRDGGRTLSLPALATAHSHAFQRAMRGTAQRRGRDPKDDFWSWRGQMYRAATELTPERLAAVSRIAFRELARAGVRTVGEFHYVQHQADGTPYDDRTLLADVVIEAAKAEGLRIALLRVAYHRAGPARPAEAGQRRFCDPEVDCILRDVDRLRARYAGDPAVRIGVAPHSVRAVPPSWLPELAAYARQHHLPFHMHVAEQQREIDECEAESGRRPVELLSDLGVLSERFVAVHATHLRDHEARLLGEARGFACLCPTTERDLGDGLCSIGPLRDAGVRLCTGIDSHVITDPFEELRSLETHERLRVQRRVTFDVAGRTPAEQLWHEGSLVGCEALGFRDTGGRVLLDGQHPTLALVAPEGLLDAVVFSGHPGLVRGFEGA
jgi:formimidoylglutamate deiminase